MSKIESIIAHEILDSRANPTIETVIILSDGTTARSSVPNGAIKGTYEAAPLFDGDMARMQGLGVLKAVDTVNNIIAPKLIGIEATEQKKIDRIMIEMDGTQNKMKLGSNSTLSISQAVAKAAAKSSLLPLSLYLRQQVAKTNREHKIPCPMFNVIEGGKHAEGGLNFQEFLLIPASSHTYEKALEIGVTIYKKLKQHLKDNNQPTLYAEEGGFAPSYTSNSEAFRSIRAVISDSPYDYLRDIFMGVDISANSFLSNNKYTLKDKNGQLSQDDLIEIYQGIFAEHSLVYFEDPFAEDDWDGWKKMYQTFSSRALICGDDITSTNPYRIQSALNNNVLNAIVIKPTQIGTVTETMAVVEIARFKQLKTVISNRSGETGDDFIADLAVAVDSDYVKFGAPSRERIIKYNRLLSIQKELEGVNLL
jgi:enolase